MPDLYALLRRGILDRGILSLLWKDYADSQTELEFLMTKHQLIVPIVSDEEDDSNRFLVPALLPAAMPLPISTRMPGIDPDRLVSYVFSGRAEDLKAERAKSTGSVAVGHVMHKLFLPKGLFTAVLGKGLFTAVLGKVAGRMPACPRTPQADETYSGLAV